MRQPRDADEPAWWFGGGMDLTPIYGFAEDARHFHAHMPRCAAPFGDDLYPRFKQCVRRLFLPEASQRGARDRRHLLRRLERRRMPSRRSRLTRSVGEHFLAAYLPILERRRDMPYGERERDFQAYRRGRYVEFNLVWDRGTLFGLQSDGRTEAILLSMPPCARWRYDWAPERRARPRRGSTPNSSPRGTGSQSDDRRRRSSAAPVARHARRLRRQEARRGRVERGVRRRAARRAARSRAPARRQRGGARVRRASRRRAGRSGAGTTAGSSSSASSAIRCNRVFLEFPAGKLDPGERALAHGMRELIEEAGYAARRTGRGSASSIRSSPTRPRRSSSTRRRGLSHVGASSTTANSSRLVHRSADELYEAIDDMQLTDGRPSRRWRCIRVGFPHRDGAAACGSPAPCKASAIATGSSARHRGLASQGGYATAATGQSKRTFRRAARRAIG